MVETDLILKNLADKTGKRKGDLKRSYNSIKKKKIEEGLDKYIPEDVLERIVLLGVSNKIGIDADELDKILASFDTVDEISPEELEEELDEAEDDDFDEIEFEEDDDEDEVGFDEFDNVDEMSEDFKVESSWEDIFSSTPEPKAGKDFERLETLLIMPGVEYILTLVDPTKLPYRHEGIDKHDDTKTYTSRAMDVILKDLSPIRKFREKYESGDDRGKKCFIKKKKYKLWMTEVAFEWFAKFWRDVGRKSPDDRSWTYEKVKKPKVTKHFFGEV